MKSGDAKHRGVNAVAHVRNSRIGRQLPRLAATAGFAAPAVTPHRPRVPRRPGSRQNPWPGAHHTARGGHRIPHRGSDTALAGPPRHRSVPRSGDVLDRRSRVVVANPTTATRGARLPSSSRPIDGHSKAGTKPAPRRPALPGIVRHDRRVRQCRQNAGLRVPVAEHATQQRVGLSRQRTSHQSHDILLHPCVGADQHSAVCRQMRSY